MPNTIHFYRIIFHTLLLWAAIRDFSNFLTHFVPIVHRMRLVLLTRSCVCTELFLLSSCLSSNICSFRVKGPMRKTSIMSSSLLLQQCSACLVRLIWIVLEMRDKWSYSCCLVGCCFQDLFSTGRSIFVELPSRFFSMRLVSVHVAHQCCGIDTTAAWEKLRSIL